MRRQFIQSLGALALGASLPWAARAQTPAWPTRPVRIIITSAAGSPWDPQTRYLAEKLAGIYGQPFIVENKPGATGMIGMDQVAKATDGHTLGVMFNPHALLPSLFEKVPYDLLRDVVPVARTEWTYNVLVTSATSPFRTMDDLVRHARANPGKLSYLSGGNGTPAHIMGEYLQQETKSTMVHVPYKGPVGALNDLVGGRGDLMFATAGSAIPLVIGGRLKALAVTALERLDSLPDIPTTAEAGYPKLEMRAWAGIVASPSVPASVIAGLNANIRKVLSDESFKETLVKRGIVPSLSSPEEFRNLIRSETEKWGPIIRAANIKLG